ncbi:MAG: AEC family transporter, partial [Limnobacter sp.]|nr:AEC family transporter [Limnobacter sp.]
LLATGLGTVFAFGLSWWWSIRMLEPSQRGVFVQGSFRGNCGVVSLALVISYFGDYGMAVGGVLAGFTILLFNTLSVFILALYSPSFQFSPKAVAKELGSNPLILSVLAGLVASMVELVLPRWVQTSAEYFAQLTLPLALICIGGTLSIAGLKHSGQTAVHSTAIKLLVAPVVSCFVAWVLGMQGKELIVLWMYLASPTAAASFAMALAAGGDGRLAANIIALTTVVSLFSITAGIFVLRAMGH